MTDEEARRSLPAPGVDWWRDAVVYQIYVRSFADGDGDGTGDIAGIRSRLGYLSALGVDAIWVNPWYRSPLRDGGYDVADYREIDERFGTVADAEAFIAEAAALGIRVLVDLVPNHTSSEHAWFRAALVAGPGSAERARYHFLDGADGEHGAGSEPPNDWTSIFGGPAWTRVADGQWYLHLFDESQPDLNWTNPEVLDEFDDILRFWLDRGAAGFRVDVAHALTKAPGYPDVGTGTNAGRGTLEEQPYFDRDDLHPIVRRWRAVLDEYDDRMMVAEAWVAPERRPLYLRPGEYHQAFDFELTEAPWDARRFAEVVGAAVAAAHDHGSSPTWALANHDVVRPATRFGLPTDVVAGLWLLDGPAELLDAERGERRARAAALAVLALPGSVYLYQGEELGLHEVWDLPAEVLQDPIWHDSGHTLKGRDGCRVPIPWEPDGPSFGFGSGPPWLPQPAWFGPASVAAQEASPTSTLQLFRSAIARRRELLVGDDTFTSVDLGADVFAFDRAALRCVVNMGEAPIELPDGSGEILLASGVVDGRLLPSDTAVWLA